jgi:NTP pyrophosphatase (non-canonical NTP hydrolase)
LIFLQHISTYFNIFNIFQHIQLHINTDHHTLIHLTFCFTMSQKTDFQCVTEFNSTFGVPIFSEPQHDIFEKNPSLVELRLSLIREEVKELEVAVKNHDLVETLDALADIIYVVQGMASSFGLDLDKAFDIVHRSNMSKVCETEDEAKETVEYYKKNMDTLGYDSPDYRSSANGKYYVVYNKSTGKVLKSINYTPAKFDWLTSTSKSVENCVNI